MSGLTVGIYSLEEADLKQYEKQGTGEKKRGRWIRYALRKQNRLLCTLLIVNTTVNMALPMFLESIVPAWASLIMSVTLVLMVGEVMPQALCISPSKVLIIAWCAANGPNRAVASAHPPHRRSRTPPSGYSSGVKAASHTLPIPRRRLAPLVRLLLFVVYPVAKPISMLLDYAIGKGTSQVHSERHVETPEEADGAQPPLEPHEEAGEQQPEQETEAAVEDEAAATGAQVGATSHTATPPARQRELARILEDAILELHAASAGISKRGLSSSAAARAIAAAARSPAPSFIGTALVERRRGRRRGAGGRRGRRRGAALPLAAAPPPRAAARRPRATRAAGGGEPADGATALSAASRREQGASPTRAHTGGRRLCAGGRHLSRYRGGRHRVARLASEAAGGGAETDEAGGVAVEPGAVVGLRAEGERDRPR